MAGSITDVPNHKLTRKEFNIPENTEFKEYTSTARVSTMVDSNMEFVISSNITYRDISEVAHAIEHLEDAKNKIDLTKTITTYDRGYNAYSLMLKTMQLESYYVIRAKESTFRKQREKMLTDDEIITININNRILNNIGNEEIREYARQQKTMKVRIVNIQLKTGETETIITNMLDTKMTKEDFKHVYNKKWTIETNYDKLKNKIQIENFSGRRKRIIQQDFYANILIFNMTTIIKHETNKEIKRKPKKTNKHKYKGYITNFNIAIGLIKDQINNMIESTRKEQKKIIEEIKKILLTNLIPIKEETQTNEEIKQKKTNYKFNDNNRRAF